MSIAGFRARKEVRLFAFLNLARFLSYFFWGKKILRSIILYNHKDLFPFVVFKVFEPKNSLEHKT